METKKITCTQIPPSTVTYVSFQVSNPVTRPVLPYVGIIPGGIKQNKAVVINGSLPPDAKSFSINFKTGTCDSDDIAFHFNPRIGAFTALNSFRNGNWETEEKAPDKPFTRGESFQVIVIIKSAGYEVKANGLIHCTFKHRIPFEKVSAIGIKGDVSIELIGFVEKWGS